MPKFYLETFTSQGIWKKISVKPAEYMVINAHLESLHEITSPEMRSRIRIRQATDHEEKIDLINLNQEVFNQHLVRTMSVADMERVLESSRDR